MSLDAQLTFRGVPHSDAVAQYVDKKAHKLATFFERIVSCRVAVESPHRHKHQGHPYRVRVELGVPGEEIVVSRDVGGDSNQDLYATVDAAFDDVQRQLQDHARLRRGDVKLHDHGRHGTVAKLFAYEGYGFIAREEEGGDEIYFHKNSVLHGAFGRMRPGTRVRFIEEPGDDGVHATSVRVLRSRKKAPAAGPPG